MLSVSVLNLVWDKTLSSGKESIGNTCTYEYRRQ